MKEFPKHPKEPEEVGVDFDEDTGCYVVYGVDSGFCYGTYADEKVAEEHANEKNKGV